jgi:formylglycine-generating enzyme required for sulfatase activity
MGSGYGGITRGGSSGTYTYSTIAGREFMPVNHVSWYDSLRFVNWLHNGQPTGVQDSTTTEDGAYTFSGPTSVGERNEGALFVLPNEDEWYKAAYYDVVSMSYFDYPAGSDEETTCALPGADHNAANCWPAVGDLTDVGSYTESASPNGSFDQGGNVWEWNETIIGSGRGLRGGSFSNNPGNLAASNRYDAIYPTDENNNAGFRVARTPEPGAALLGVCALLTLALLRRHQHR